MTTTSQQTPTSQQTLTAQFSALGVPRGGLLMVHASLRAVGPTEGRARGLLAALAAALGPEGTLLMVLAADVEDPFDPLETPVDVEDMGWLAEVFRTYPGVRVSDHPAARFAALGALAPGLLADPPLDDYFGPGSTLERFLEHGGQVLRLGANVDTITLAHHAEYRAGIPEARRVRRRYRRADGRVQWVACLDDSLGLVDWPEGDYFETMCGAFLETEAVRRGPVGGCRAELFQGADFMAFCVPWMQQRLMGLGRGELRVEEEPSG